MDPKKHQGVLNHGAGTRSREGRSARQAMRTMGYKAFLGKGPMVIPNLIEGIEVVHQ
jgi:hypothetical protein